MWLKRILQDAAERNLRNTVKDATSQGDINHLKNTIIKFKQAGLDDKGDYAKASVRLELLEVKQGNIKSFEFCDALPKLQLYLSQACICAQPIQIVNCFIVPCFLFIQKLVTL